MLEMERYRELGMEIGLLTDINSYLLGIML